MDQSITKIEEMKAISKELVELAKRQEEPIPSEEYQNLRKLIGQFGEDYKPDMDAYFYSLYSPCRWIKDLLNKPLTDIVNIKLHFEKPLEDVYPNYKPIFKVITLENTPKLLGRLQDYSLMRKKLLIILDMHLHQIVDEPITT